MKLFYLLILTSVLIFGSNRSNAQVLITGFGSSQFTIAGDVTTFTTTSQTSSTTNAIGSDIDIVAGTFTPIDISGFNTIELVASVSGTNPNSGFSVELFNTDFTETRTYTSFTSFFTSSPTAVILTFVTQSSSFSTIAGFQFSGLGSGEPLDITFDSITAVPEPTTWALLAGSLTITTLLRRRRRV